MKICLYYNNVERLKNQGFYKNKKYGFKVGNKDPKVFTCLRFSDRHWNVLALDYSHPAGNPKVTQE